MAIPFDSAGTESAQPQQDSSRQHTFTVTVPSFQRVTDGALNAAMVPVALARQVLPAKKGLPLYLGLGVLAAVDVLEWPVALGIGLGYAVLRRDGGLIGAPPSESPAPGPQGAQEPVSPPAPPTGQAAADAPAHTLWSTGEAGSMQSGSMT
ncbi:hypothetical protein ABZ924_29515 [Streptomyces sp. NPDC046876]|uniref:hypothetical protein n=1 Tax=Streptomyces sp. NPDC046876 TaxID=3155616 RepID=UPI0033FC62D4